jgi:SAM-dependent methyltransferase
VEVTAIDLSRSSLAYATKMARKMNLANIEFYQADILELQSMKDRFHIIECSGVLHHMEDPIQGWKNLIGLLEPGGLVKIALYSQRARQVISGIRDLISENKMTPSNEHIRIFRQAILDNLIDGDFTELKQSADFYNLSGCRDLLFHVQEHQFTPLQIEDAINSLGLEFLGFVNLPFSVKKMFEQQFGAKADRTCLENWDTLEEISTGIFGNMYQFYCRVAANDIAMFPMGKVEG